jgi:hypothetical protein
MGQMFLLWLFKGKFGIVAALKAAPLPNRSPSIRLA